MTEADVGDRPVAGVFARELETLLTWAGILSVVAFGGACAAGGGNGQGASSGPSDPYREARLRMVSVQIERRGVRDAAVLQSMRSVPRHLFVPPGLVDAAHQDSPLGIGYGQTISQPYIVALMTELIRPERSMKVLEIGTGSGYQAAVLAECVGQVYSIEIVPELGRLAREVLEGQGYRNIHLRIGDGYDGWPDAAPFDAILLTAAPEAIPQPLLDQLAPGGRLVAPVGAGIQDLVVVTRTEDGFHRRVITGVRFVPMTGKAQDER